MSDPLNRSIAPYFNPYINMPMPQIYIYNPIYTVINQPVFHPPHRPALAEPLQIPVDDDELFSESFQAKLTHFRAKMNQRMAIDPHPDAPLPEVKSIKGVKVDKAVQTDHAADTFDHVLNLIDSKDDFLSLLNQ